MSLKRQQAPSVLRETLGQASATAECFLNRAIDTRESRIVTKSGTLMAYYRTNASPHPEN